MLETPLNRYQADLVTSGFSKDPAQQQAVERLQALYDTLIDSHDQSDWATGSDFWRRARGLFITPAEVRGLYMWGGVGRGKTYLMDIFYDSLPFEHKMRTHFHRFMRRVHKELSLLNAERDPLKLVAAKLAKEARVLCFDEFFVVDITDAMILAGLLEQLFKRGVVLVATSNIAPPGLYENGLQRARFLPAIALLQQHTEVLNVDGGKDYRLRTLEQAELYYLSSDASAHQLIEQCFAKLAPEKHFSQQSVEIEIEGRMMQAERIADDVAWFEFRHLCDGPRSQNDYIELAREFHAVIVENVPLFTEHNDDQARRFINMVDEFYDRNVKLILSAQAPILELYSSGRLSFEFQRTQSRVQEMQSTEYLARAHRA
ncbi:cell division protein ZapE [Alteromonadaceae bacterium Bs31]|nr:cell division protein ZapE [Alteromonadaceae bacterium Bs31]